MSSAVKPSPADTADRVHSGAIRLLRRLRKQDAASGLSGPQASALSVLIYGGAMNLGRLAATEQVKAPTMSRLVKDMEATGLVLRRRDPDDARGVILDATEKGRAMFDRARERRLTALTAAVAALDAADQVALDRAARLMLFMAGGQALD
jgi:DNA-binding MarR family transcriptional regulator